MKIILTLLFILPAIAQAQKNPLLPGKAIRKDTVIRFNDTNEYSRLPVTVINGKEQGAVFTIVAGIHGYEYPPIIAVQELMQEINPAQLKGTIIILPLSNVAAFYTRTPFINPIDGINLNNAFPGSATGSVSQQIAYWITTEIISRSDVFLDIHGGDANEDLLPFICYYNNQSNSNKTTAARQLSEASGIGHIVSYPYTITKTEPAKYAFKQATQNDITALSIEVGKLGNVESEEIQQIKNAVYNMLSYQQMYTVTTKKYDRPTTAKRLNDQYYIRVPESGFFYSEKKAGDEVTIGENLGHITNEFGKKLHTVTANKTGIILYKVGTPPVNKGETLFCIGF